MIGPVIQGALLALVITLYVAIVVRMLRRSHDRHPVLWAILALLWPLMLVVGNALSAMDRRQAARGFRR